MVPLLYNDQFYAGQASQALDAARVMLPSVLEIVPAESLIDVGCGLGGWPQAALELGVRKVEGVDGAYVDLNSLLMPKDQFRPVDLSMPGSLSGLGQFELSISLEVAEHLPADRAQTFVDELTEFAPAVLFSAAIPYQGGTGHVNEQWPSYWAELFLAHDYRAIDLRRQFWGIEGVPNWYRQNMLLYVEPAHPAAVRAVERVIDAVLPAHYTWQHEHRPPLYLHDLARALPGAIRHADSSRMSRR